MKISKYFHTVNNNVMPHEVYLGPPRGTEDPFSFYPKLVEMVQSTILNGAKYGQCRVQEIQG